MTRDEILSQNPISTFLERQGINLKGNPPKQHCTRCPLIQHKPMHLCVDVDIEKQVWFCNDCKIGGSVIDWLIHQTGKTAGEILISLDPGSNGKVSRIALKSPTVGGQRTNAPNQSVGLPEATTIQAAYSYVDENGNELYQSVRYPAPPPKNKHFKQRHMGRDGKWIWNMDGVTRVLFQLPQVLLAQEVVISEGEKDCLTLGKHGFVATTNVGGAENWLPAYDEALVDKDILIFFDNDDAGRRHVDKVIASLRDKVNSIKKIQVPLIFKDVSDFLESFSSIDTGKSALLELISSTPHLLKPPPIYSISEMEAEYSNYLDHSAEHQYDLHKFLPSLGRLVGEPLESGELVLIVGDTGIGKSALLQALAKCSSPLPTLFFEMELPLTLLFQRFVQMELGCFARDVALEYRNDRQLRANYPGLKHIMVCPESGITIPQIESYIVKSALKFGKSCAVVCVDYVGLISGPGKSRYEQISNSAEQLKVIAKRTNTILFVASQVSRPEDKKASKKIRLHDAKDSGALENSAGLLLGCTRSEDDKMIIEVLKNTKGKSNVEITVKFDGARMQITEL
jgi:energy-coupling factor transporter ATP-binding protein EcfA2/5S rRNA maturation endonuclease (ribonuclease M5)